jgi:hypothetical protein
MGFGWAESEQRGLLSNGDSPLKSDMVESLVKATQISSLAELDSMLEKGVRENRTALG